jgi:hypothetical protein
MGGAVEEFLTENEWLACNNQGQMVNHLLDQGIITWRKMRLFACACVRRIWHLIGDERGYRAVEVAERFADDQATKRELAAVCKAATDHSYRDGPYQHHAEHAAAMVAGDDINLRHAPGVAIAEYHRIGGHPTEQTHQAALLRDLLGNPFRPITVPGAWQTPSVVALAEAAYVERILPSGHLDPARLAVLSDALEDTGCADVGVLAHLRNPGPHVRGCWVVDLVLGKE